MRFIPGATDREQHEITCALLDAARISGVRFSVSKEFWRGYQFYDSLDVRVYGTFEQWLNVAARRPKILWDDGETDTLLCLEHLLPTEFDMRLERYADGKAPPKPRRRPNAGPTENDEEEAGEDINIQYKVGHREEVQSWRYRTPESITEDARKEDRHRPAINRDRSQYRTLYDFFVNVAVPMPLIQRMFGATGWINARLTGTDNHYLRRKTSVGEGLQFLGYMIALANNPGRPLRSMWAEKRVAGEKSVLPPANVGSFGMSQHRFNLLMSLVPKCYSIEESELDTSDPWRYVQPLIDAFNEHWKEVYFPSWLLSPDELMSFWTPEEGDGPNDLPFMSYVPRKPRPRGCELKTVCDGESGCLIRVEIALRYKRRRGAPEAVPPYSEEWGHTSALCLRLCEPWHNTQRVFGADAHFMSMDSAEALREHVSPAQHALPATCWCMTRVHRLRVAGYLCVRRSQADERKVSGCAARAALRPRVRRLGGDVFEVWLE